MKVRSIVRSIPAITACAVLTAAVQAACAQAQDAASPAAVNRLHVGTEVKFDGSVRTVGDAMNQLLGPVRYALTTRTVDPERSDSVLRRPVPLAARDHGVMTVEGGLLLLIGEDNRLVVDHVHRLVAIERMPALDEASH